MYLPIQIYHHLVLSVPIQAIIVVHYIRFIHITDTFKQNTSSIDNIFIKISCFIKYFCSRLLANAKLLCVTLTFDVVTDNTWFLFQTKIYSSFSSFLSAGRTSQRAFSGCMTFSRTLRSFTNSFVSGIASLNVIYNLKQVTIG